MVAFITIGVANRSRCAARLCPCLFRRTGFDQKKTLVVPHAIVSLSHPSDHSVSDINRIKRHIAFVPPSEPYAIAKQPFRSHVSTPMRLITTGNRFWRWRPHREPRCALTSLKSARLSWKSSAQRQTAMGYRRYSKPCPISPAPRMRFFLLQRVLLRRSLTGRLAAV
jgi:hypothetical protein